MLRASCPQCAAITSSFERAVLRESLGSIRAVLNIRSRRKKHRAKTLHLKMEKNGKEFIQEVPLEDFPPLIPSLYIEPPTYIQTCQRHHTGAADREAEIRGRLIYKSDDQIDELLKKYNGDKIKLSYTFDPMEFGRMLAKIAYCFAVDRFGLGGIADNYVLPAILGETEDIWHFVGCDFNYLNTNTAKRQKDALKKQDALIWVDLSVVDGDIFAWVRIFPQFDYPVYMVVVGRASEALRGMLQSAGWKLS